MVYKKAKTQRNTKVVVIEQLIAQKRPQPAKR